MAVSAIGIIALFLAVALNISHFFIKDLEKAELRLMEMATRDHLTGLANRREGLRQAGEEMGRAGRTGNPLFAMMIDIDHFKKINDTHGHAAGDAVLQEVARRMKSGVREYDVLCRYGGEEFLVITPESGISQAISVAERLRMLVAKDPIGLEKGDALNVTVSGGGRGTLHRRNARLADLACGRGPLRREGRGAQSGEDRVTGSSRFGQG